MSSDEPGLLPSPSAAGSAAPSLPSDLVARELTQLQTHAGLITLCEVTLKHAAASAMGIHAHEAIVEGVILMFQQLVASA